MKNILAMASVLVLPPGSISVAHAAQPSASEAPTCNALVDVTNDLFLVDENGALIRRFTNDGLPKRSASLAPDQNRVAFIPDMARHAFNVVNGDGLQRSVSVPNKVRVAGEFVGVSWSSDDVVRLQ